MHINDQMIIFLKNVGSTLIAQFFAKKSGYFHVGKIRKSDKKDFLEKKRSYSFRKHPLYYNWKAEIMTVIPEG